MRSPAPDERALFFIRNKKVAALAAGWPAEQARAKRDYYMLVNMSQGYLRDLSGEVHTPIAADGDLLGGGRFSDEVAVVREAIARDYGLRPHAKG
ncbi:MAG TPA: hypothetical protein VLM76_10160 [Patescibacteria group bacterium]|nr:hypothetical protein [Patescibacteria group bacterium]